MPCRDLLSAATLIPPASRRGLENPRQALCSAKNTSFRCRLLGLAGRLFFCSVFRGGGGVDLWGGLTSLIFCISAAEAKALLERH